MTLCSVSFWDEDTVHGRDVSWRDLIRVAVVQEGTGFSLRGVKDALMCVALASVAGVHMHLRGHGRALMDAARQKETFHA